MYAIMTCQFRGALELFAALFTLVLAWFGYGEILVIAVAVNLTCLVLEQTWKQRIYCQITENTPGYLLQRTLQFEEICG